MTRNLKLQPSAGTLPNQVAKASRRDSGAHAGSSPGSGRTVTRTSERIIQETSVKRRNAMEMLANQSPALLRLDEIDCKAVAASDWQDLEEEKQARWAMRATAHQPTVEI